MSNDSKQKPAQKAPEPDAQFEKMKRLDSFLDERSVYQPVPKKNTK